MVVDTRALMQRLADAILKEARARIPGGPNGRAGEAISIESVGPFDLTIRADEPASFLIAGWPRRQMTWLLGKTVAFTPKGGGGRIVRKVSAKSLAEGHWWRPARAPDDVLGAAWQSPGTQSVAEEIADLMALPLGAQSGGFTWMTSPSRPGSILPDLF